MFLKISNLTKNLSLHFKILLLVIGANLITATVISFYSIINSQQIATSSIGADLKFRTNSYGISIGDAMARATEGLGGLVAGNDIQSDLRAINESYGLNNVVLTEARAKVINQDAQWRQAYKDGNDKDPLVSNILYNSLSAILKRYAERYPSYTEITIIDIYAGLAASTRFTSQYDQSNQEWVQYCMAGLGPTAPGSLYISIPRYDEQINKFVVDVAIPVRDSKVSQLLGAIRATYIMPPLNANDPNTHFDMLFVTIPPMLFHEQRFEETNQEFVNSILEVAKEDFTLMDFDGVDAVVSVAPVKTLAFDPYINGRGWYVITHENRAEVLLPVQQQVRTSLLLVVVIITITSIIGYRLTQLITSPILRLTEIAKKIQNGDISAQIKLDSKDEVGILAGAFNQMTAQLRSTILSLEQRVVDRTRDLTLAADISGRLSQEAQTAREELETQTRHLTRQGWIEYLNAIDRGEYIESVYHNHQTPIIEKLPQPSSNILSFPITIIDQNIGSVDLQRDHNKSWTDEERGLISKVAEQVSHRLEALRLLAQTESYRADAEEASRRLTRQSWHAYLENRKDESIYFYNQNVVVSANEAELDGFARDALKIPLRIRDEVVGELLVDSFDKENLEISEFISLIADRLSSHIETLRLNEQTQANLAQTDALYGIITDLNAASNFQDVLTAVREHTILNQADLSTILCFFDRPMGGNEKPEWVIPVASHVTFDLLLAERYPLSAFEVEPDMLFTSQINILEDIDKDVRLDRITQKLFVEVFKAKTAMIVPLILVDQMIGFILANFSTNPTYTPLDKRRLSAVAGQAAISLQGLRLLEQSLARARREQLLREITTQVNKAVDTDTVMRRAVQELGKVMQKKAYIYLGEGDISKVKEDHLHKDPSINADGIS